MKDTGYHQANFIANQVLEEIQQVKSTVLEAIDDFKENQNPNIPQPVPEYQANATITGQATNDLVALIKQLQLEVKQLKETKLGPVSDTGTGSTERKQYERTVTNKYCWSHGGCTHLGKDCRKKRKGHKDEATFNNKMGGSIYYCPATTT